MIFIRAFPIQVGLMLLSVDHLRQIDDDRTDSLIERRRVQRRREWVRIAEARGAQPDELSGAPSLTHFHSAVFASRSHLGVIDLVEVRRLRTRHFRRPRHRL
jgi:hypothetical protein